MRYQDFLNIVVDEEIKVVHQDYNVDGMKVLKGSMKAILEGSLAGLEACRDKSPPQLAQLLDRAGRVQLACFHSTVSDRYWRVNCFFHEVEWVCNVISAALVNQGVQPIVAPTMKAAIVAERISKGSEQQPN